jgi:hypothetical protein
LDAPGGFGMSSLEEMRHEKNPKGIFELSSLEEMRHEKNPKGIFELSSLEEMRHEKNPKGFFEVRQRSIRRIQQDSSNSGSYSRRILLNSSPINPRCVKKEHEKRAIRLSSLM